MTTPTSETVCVAVALPIPPRRSFTYRVPDRWQHAIAPGVVVRVPFGPRKLRGVVVDVVPAPDDPSIRLRDIAAVLDDPPAFTDELLQLSRFVADYYLCSWGEALEAAMPPPAASARIDHELRRGVGAEPSFRGGAVRQRQLWSWLPEDGGWRSERQLPGELRPSITALQRRGWIERRATEAEAVGSPQEPTFELSVEQERVLAILGTAIEAGEYAPFLLYGATGSGKTEVYLRSAERTLAAGRSVLYLVPEIGLTPLLQEKIERRFPGQVVVLHSGLRRSERRQAWDRVRDGRCRFVVGTRSAVFAPLHDTGLILVDEEHDGSYKQSETPRYHGRDVAVVRARNNNAIVVLGSATPALESFSHAQAGHYRLLELGGRVTARPLPTVTTVDMREQYGEAGSVLTLAPETVTALQECMERGEQAMILRNRRGWATTLLCHACGERVVCGECSLTLTWHRRDRRLRCHTCAAEHPYPDACPTCEGKDLQLLGEGTERVEDRLAELFPDAVIGRMDRDTIRGRGAHAKMLERVDRREIDILVGTQMIAKGHDFAGVTLVCVLSADQSLGVPDFRAAERTFQLLTQVSGRAGRGEAAGRVVVQAFDPQHPILQFAAQHDYDGFYRREIRFRQALRYPPAAAMVRLLVQHEDELQAREWAQMLGEAIRDRVGDRAFLSGPGPAPIERIQGRFRQMLLARSPGRRQLVTAIDEALEVGKLPVPRRAIQVDVDPLSLL
ncbi:MAG: primosomal protein N' [Acidobacteriota bacterium]|nr:primosomal protein N' [Acidobacteriota bacterium]MDH3784594.1 primosomal protein N' [Acidobacteriota bacterium]